MKPGRDWSSGSQQSAFGTKLLGLIRQCFTLECLVSDDNRALQAECCCSALCRNMNKLYGFEGEVTKKCPHNCL